MVTYWFMGRGFDKAKGEKLAVVPDDFRMVGGNMTRDFLDLSIPSHDAVSFQCFGPGYDRESLSDLATWRERRLARE